MESWRTTNRWIATLQVCLLLCSGFLALQFNLRTALAVDTASDSRGSEYSIADIRAKLREQLTSIHSVWCEYKVHDSADYDTEKPDTWPTYVWAQRNTHVLHRILPHQPKSIGGQWVEEFLSFDGKAGYQVVFQTKEKSLQYAIHRYSSAPPYISAYFAPAHSLGLFVRGSTSNLLALLDRAEIVRPNHALVDGRRTIRVVIKSYISGHRLILQLDPEADFLPKEIASFPDRVFEETTQTGNDRNFVGQVGDVVWKIGVRSFMQIDDPGIGRKRWFPQQLTANDQLVGVVDRVRINEEIPLAAFQPIFSKGVRVIDNPGTPQSRESVYGSQSQEPNNPSSVIGSENSNLPIEKLIEAKTPGWNFVSNAFLLAAFVFISICVCVVWRRAV